MSTNGVFHIGDKVVYPNHGVGIIEQISSRTLGGTVEKFYQLKIAASNLTVTVPFANVGNVGMRPVVRNGEVEKIVDYLSSGECINAADWKDRYKENSDRMRTGSLSDVATVLKGLLILAQAKALSFREKKMLERARYLLVSEIAISRNCPESIIEEALTEALTKCDLHFPEISELAS
jgi:CarD family transcriptional regulator